MRRIRHGRVGSGEPRGAGPPSARPTQDQSARPDDAELVICDQTIDEHRIGLKPLLHKVWTLDDHRPFAPVEHRFAWRYLVGFVHPASGRTVFHLATSVSVALFEAELEAFASKVGAGPRKEIVLVLDRAGWHASLRLRVPEPIHLLFLPPYSPELQPSEHLWPLTNTVLVNRHFTSIDELENIQAERVVELGRRRDLVRSATLFSWWPKRIHRRNGPPGRTAH
ncbi:MAG: IS630 family transposase [Ktedonobacterales bacterium]